MAAALHTILLEAGTARPSRQASGAPAPTGTQLYLLVEVESGANTDLVLNETRAQLSGLGPSVQVIAP